VCFAWQALGISNPIANQSNPKLFPIRGFGTATPSKRDRLLALEMEIRRKLEIEQYHQNLLDFYNTTTTTPTSTPTPTLTPTTGTETGTGTGTATATLTLTTESASKQRIKYKDITVPVPMEISLICAQGKSKEYLNGVVTRRNTSMAALARDLLGVQAEFQQLGQTTDDDGYTLFLDACRRCSLRGGWDELEWQPIWDYAIKSNPISSIKKYIRDRVETCIKGEDWRFLKSQQPSED
jgi:hypothetical protein